MEHKLIFPLLTIMISLNLLVFYSEISVNLIFTQDKWSEIAKNGHSVEVAEDIDTMTLKALLKCAFGDFPLSEKYAM